MTTRLEPTDRHEPREGRGRAQPSSTVTDTDRFVEAVSPVIEDPWARSALADRINQDVLAYVDVQPIANQAV